jgi:DNA-directed RNA polymerase, mitochondrial
MPPSFSADRSIAEDHKDRLAPFLSLVKPENLSLITILELMHLHGSGGIAEGMKTARALLAVGRAVEIEYKAQICKSNNISIPSQGARNDVSYFSNLGYRDLHARRVAARKYMEDSEDWTAEWSQIVRVRVGSFLVDALMDVATVTRTAVSKHTGETM